MANDEDDDDHDDDHECGRCGLTFDTEDQLKRHAQQTHDTGD